LKNRAHFLKYLNKFNIMAQQHYIPIYKFSIYNEKSNKFIKNTVSIPIFVNLNTKDQNKIINTIKNYLN
jgi:dTDP-4-amino-4,6-dideoxygalactose transaminase